VTNLANLVEPELLLSPAEMARIGVAARQHADRARHQAYAPMAEAAAEAKRARNAAKRLAVSRCRICGGDHPWQRCGND